MSHFILDMRKFQHNYFPFGETAVNDLIEGQLAFLHHVRTYEAAHPGTRFLQKNLCWKIEFLNCCLGSLPKEQLDEISSEISEVVRLGGTPNSWAVRSSKTMSRALRHELGQKLGKYLEASMEQPKARPCGLSTGSRESFSLSSWRTARAVSRRGLHLSLAPLSAFWIGTSRSGFRPFRGTVACLRCHGLYLAFWIMSRNSSACWRRVASIRPWTVSPASYVYRVVPSEVPPQRGSLP